jgi:sensor histidine kinase YesM
MTPKEIGLKALRLARMISLVGAITGVIVYLIIGGRDRFEPFDLFMSVVIGTIYSATMWGVQDMAGAFLERHIPLVTKWSVAARMVIHSIAVVFSFLLATALIDLIFDPWFINSSGTMIVIAFVAFSMSLIGNGLNYLDAFYKRIREAERSALGAELGALRARINPHFLFNSLNSIAALIRTRPEEAEAVTEALADLFRYSLRASEQPDVSLADEIEAAELYLQIERARFRERLQVTIDVPHHLQRVKMPSLIVQPLVENAVKHGLGRTEGRCEVVIRGRETTGGLSLTVTDTGPGFDSADPETIFVRGHGLANVRDRLRHQFGETASLKIMKNGVEILLPVAESLHAPAARREMV